MLDRRVRLQQLYDEIYAYAAANDPQLRPRVVIDSMAVSEVVLVAQALGRDTQRLSGFPYVFPGSGLSKGGATLDRFLAEFGYTIDPGAASRRYAFHTDLVPWFPGRNPRGSGDKVPTPEEIGRCWEWLEREIEIVAPRVVIALGLPAAKELLSRHGGMRVTRASPKLGDLLGGTHTCTFDGRALPTFVVHHPSGAFQHPASGAVYKSTGEAISGTLDAARKAARRPA